MRREFDAEYVPLDGRNEICTVCAKMQRNRWKQTKGTACRLTGSLVRKSVFQKVVRVFAKLAGESPCGTLIPVSPDARHLAIGIFYGEHRKHAGGL